MPAEARFRVEPSDLQKTAKKVEGVATTLGHSIRELGGVQHAQNAADSPEVAGAIVALVNAWGTEFANLAVFVTEMANKLESAATCYVSTDASAGNWATALMTGAAGGAANGIARPGHHPRPVIHPRSAQPG